MAATLLDSVRYHMVRVSNQREKRQPKRRSLTASGSSRSIGHTLQLSEDDPQEFLSLEAKILESFHAGGVLTNQITIAKYIFDEIPTCKQVLLMRVTREWKSVRLYCRGVVPCDPFETYRIADFECIQEIVSSRTPVVHNDSSSKSITILCQWKPFFGNIPDVAVGIPIVNIDGKVTAIVALAFKGKLPKGFFDKKIPQVVEILDVLVPYAFIAQGRNDNEDAIACHTHVFQSLEKVEKVVGTHSAYIALTQIGTQIAALAKCKNLTIFSLDEGDQTLRKFHTNFGHPGRSNCPDKRLHSMTDIPLTEKGIEILAWVAAHKEGLKANQPSDLAEFGIHTKHIHTIGSCTTTSVLVAAVTDFSGDKTIIVELSEKDKVFTLKELEMVLSFCQHAACLLTCSVLIDRRERNFRRRNIINEMLASISFVKHDNVEQFITHHRKTSNVYRGRFEDFNLCVRCINETDIAGIVLEAFYELNILKDFKIRRAVLVRFIMSVQQGYGPLPYHNWYHAVSVAHFSYLLIKNLRLIEQGHLTKLEAFALVVSALTHDIDHRGTNNQFQSYTNSDIFKLYASEDSVMERHHLAIALAILHREDCNILESFNDVDYKYFVELLTWNIIATDISKHLKNRETLFLDAKSGNPKQRKMARLSLFMTAADLCDNVKRWDDNLLTVKGILQEFFTQGDMEKQLGFSPIQMMDRKQAYVPLIEYKFVKYIVSPVYRYLVELYEELVPCLENILRLEDLWALATYVFDSKKDKYDLLDILDLPEMKEDALWKLKTETNIEDIKKNQFAPPAIAQQPPNGPSGNVHEKSKRGSGEKSKSHLSFGEDLEEVDTGEKQKCCKCLCLKRCRK